MKDEVLKSGLVYGGRSVGGGLVDGGRGVEKWVGL